MGVWVVVGVEGSGGSRGEAEVVKLPHCIEPMDKAETVDHA